MFIKCSPAGMELTVDVCAFSNLKMDYTKTNIANYDNCGPVLHHDVIVMYSFSTSDCGTTTINNGTHFIYSNRISGSVGIQNSVISRTREVDIGFSCAIKKDQTVSLAYGLPAKVKRSSGQAENEMDRTTPIISKQWYQNNKELRKNLELTDFSATINVEFELLSPKIHFLKVRYCWLSKSLDPMFPARTYIFKNSCQQSLAKMEEETAGHLVRLSFDPKILTSLSSQYLHCQMKICQSKECEVSCDEKRLRFRPKTQEKDFNDIVFVKLGPLVIEKNNK